MSSGKSIAGALLMAIAIAAAMAAALHGVGVGPTACAAAFNAF